MLQLQLLKKQLRNTVSQTLQVEDFQPGLYNWSSLEFEVYTMHRAPFFMCTVIYRRHS